jgi:hypothetical protein
MSIQGTDADTGPPRDIFQAYSEPEFRESRLGGVDQ